MKLFAIIACALVASHAALAQAPEKQLEEARLLVDGAQGDYSKLVAAHSILEAIISAHPNDVRPRIELARIELYSGYVIGNRYEPDAVRRAEDTLQKALAIDPKAGDAYLLLADLRRLEHRNDEAAALLAKGEALGADPLQTQLSRANLHANAMQCDRAMPLFQSLANRPEVRRFVTTRALEGIADCGETLKQYDVAQAAYQRLIAFSPGHPWPYGNYAVFLRIYRNDLDAAETNARRALAMRDYGAARNALATTLYMKWGKALIEEKNLEKARKLFVEAQSFDPQPTIVLHEAPLWPTVQPVIPALKTIGVSIDFGEGPGMDSLLTRALWAKNHGLAEQVLALGADVNARGFRKTTPLMAAAMRGDTIMVNLLLSRGADPTLVNESNETASDKARMAGFNDLAKALDRGREVRAPAPVQAEAPGLPSPFRGGALYRVKKIWAPPPGLVQPLPNVGDEARYDWVMKSPFGDLMFRFRRGDSTGWVWLAKPDELSTWSEYLEEVAEAPR